MSRHETILSCIALAEWLDTMPLIGKRHAEAIEETVWSSMTAMCEDHPGLWEALDDVMDRDECESMADAWRQVLNAPST